MGAVIRSGDYKYIHHFDNDRHELFNLRQDIGEKVNLYSAEQTKVVELRAKLMAWLKSTDAQLPRLYKDISPDELPGKKHLRSGQ